MKCSKCGVELSDGSQYCNACGTKINSSLKCVKCGADIPINSKFCNVCGVGVDSLNAENKDLQQNQLINPIEKTIAKNDSPKPKKSRNILVIGGVALIGIVIISIVIILAIGAIVAFSGDMSSNSNNGQTGNSNQATNNQVTNNNYNAKQAAYDDYYKKIQAVNTQTSLMASYTTPGNQPTDLADYKTFLDSYKTQIDVYETKCNDAIAAGKIYAQYLDQGSSDYNNILTAESKLTNSVSQYRQSYSQAENAYNKAVATQNAYNDYESKLRLLGYAYNDLHSYVNSTDSYTQLSQAWLEGYKQRIDTYVQRGNDVIDSGKAYQQYLSPGTTAYNSVANNEQIINNNIKNYQDSYNDIESNYQSIQQAGNLLKWLIPFM